MRTRRPCQLISAYCVARAASGVETVSTPLAARATQYALMSWHGRRVLITGHTGFKGSWLAWWLAREGASVGGFALAPEEGRPSLFGALRLDDVVESTIGDVRDADAVDRAVRRFRPDAVFHL